MKAVVIVGPTAIGKTALSLELAGKNFEIISADSVQVYRYLDIGSGKPELQERGLVPHHCIDIVDPDYPFTAGEFVKRAHESVALVNSREKYPLFTGGTGLYIRSFFDGISDIPNVDFSVRKELMRELDQVGSEVLHKRLLRIDPAFAEKVHPNDRQRIIRGLEVYRGTGKTLSSFFSVRSGARSNDTLYVGLFDERDKVRDNIFLRVDKMIRKGLVEEVVSVRKKGFGPELKSMKTIGYSEINRYLDAEITLDEAIETIKQNTAAYAKRQMTWFKKNSEVNWYRPSEIDKIKESVKRWLQ